MSFPIWETWNTYENDYDAHGIILENKKADGKEGRWHDQLTCWEILNALSSSVVILLTILKDSQETFSPHYFQPFLGSSFRLTIKQIIHALGAPL